MNSLNPSQKTPTNIEVDLKQSEVRIAWADGHQSTYPLDYLRQIRLLKGANLDRRGQPQSYIVNPIFYQPVSSTLSSMHYLY